MVKVYVGFDITSFTPEQIAECRKSYTMAIRKASILPDFAAQHSDKIVKMMVILGMLEAWERGGILGYGAYLEQAGVEVAKKPVLN